MKHSALIAVLVLAACGSEPLTPDGRLPSPPAEGAVDAGMVDAGAVDAAPADAIPIPADDPCIYLPNPDEDETAVPNYPIRFKQGQGLEISPDLRQEGLLELQNAHVDNREVIEKRRGAVQLGDLRSATPGDVVPDADRRALWARGDEVLLETNSALYQERKAATAFTWSRVASWMRMRLREFYANTFSADVLSADYAVIGDATLVAYQEGVNLPRFAIYGPSMAREVLETLPSTSPTKVRLSSPEDFIVVTFQNQIAGFPLVARTWTPGASATAPLATIATPMPASAGVWDVHSAKTAQGDRVTAWAAAAPTAPEMTLRVQIGAVTGILPFAAAPANLADVAVGVWPRRIGNGVQVVTLRAFNNAGTWTVNNTWANFDVATGSLTGSVGASTPLADTVNQVHSIAISYTDRSNAYVAVEQTSGTTRKVTYYTLARTAGLVATGIVHESTALVGQGTLVSGTPTDILVSAGAEPLSPGFVEQLLSNNVITRSGWVVFAPRTNEIVARAYVGYTGDISNRTARPAKGSFIANGEYLTWGGAASVPSDPSTTLRAVAICKLDRTARANKPALIDGSAVSPHAGYPRAYDGTRAFEHDWHTLPRITGTGTVAGAGINAGTYNFAATWEHDDANGLRYRSAPDFLTGLVVGAPILSFNITVQPMSHTERTGVKVVIWRTLANGSVYKRAGEAAITGATQTVNIAATDATLSTSETLDQAPVPAGTGVLPSVPGRVTDFIALLIDRLASRDPRDGSLMTFTIPSRESTGYAAHWPGDVVQEPLERDVTGAFEMDGRLIMASRLGLAQLLGDGPDATGEGSFGIPLILRTPVGVTDQTVTERVPMGYVFGSPNGPRLLSPALQVQDLDAAVERLYSIDGEELVGTLYDSNREEIVLLGSEVETVRLGSRTARWASDSARLGRDITRTEDGTVYLLRSDGKVLRQSDEVFADGVTNYTTRVTTPWIREVARDGLAHGGFIFNGVEVFGEYVGPHALTVTVWLDFRDTPVIFQGTIPQADIVANAAVGRDYRYVLYTEARHCYACKVRVETSAVAGATTRIAGIDVRYNSDGSADPAQVAEEQRFPLDVSFLA